MNEGAEYLSAKTLEALKSSRRYAKRASYDIPHYSRAEQEFDIEAAYREITRALMSFDDLRRCIGTHDKDWDL